MPTQLMPSAKPTTPKPAAQTTPPPSAQEGGLTVEQIIAKARSAPTLASPFGVFLLSALTGALYWASFTPLDWAPLAWIALVPVMQLIRITKPTRWMYTSIYACSFCMMFATLQWMRLGDTAMYMAWFALSIYTAFYLPVFVGLSRVAVHRYSLPLTLTVPVVWTGLEFFRAHLLTGFSWYYLGHSQYRFVELIQISDLVGAYGVSFLVALVAATLAGMVPKTWWVKLRLLPPGAALHEHDSRPNRKQVMAVVVSLTAFACVVGYGHLRRGHADFQPGPRVALVQGNFTSSLKHDPGQAQRIYETHYFLSGLAVRQGGRPDVIVWPETMYRAPLLETASSDISEETLRRAAPNLPVEAFHERRVHTALTNLSEQCGAAMIIGVDAGVVGENGFKHYNSAAYVLPEIGVVSRYDKMHRVIFGEYIPLVEAFPFLQAFTPVAAGGGLSAGEGAAIFELGKWRMSPIICYEDTVPHLVRDIAHSSRQAEKPVDVFVNLTNDGWFHGSSELDQHLITAQFRAVETRTPLVRAVNTGISAIIDGDGVVLEPEVFIDADNEGRTSIRDPKTGKYHKQMNAVQVHDVPLDNRESFYVRHGDWFAGSCGIGVGLLCVTGLLGRRKQQPRGPITT